MPEFLSSYIHTQVVTMNKLDQEEQEILEAFEGGAVKRVDDAFEIQKRHQAYAEAMFGKDTPLSIRLSSKDLQEK